MINNHNLANITRRAFLRIAALGGVFSLMTACGIELSAPSTPSASAENHATATATLVQMIQGNNGQAISPASLDCRPEPIVVPTAPAEIPGYTMLDPSTGLHMTGTVQYINLETYRLKVGGKVDHPLSLTYDELRCLPKITARPTLICRGYFEDVATWSGASLKTVLELAGVQSTAKSITLAAAGGFEATIPLDEALREDNFLAYEWAGQPVPILHGFPIRAVLPSMFGNRWVKWLTEIRVE